MSRSILHIDMNNFYASVEALYNPALRDIPMAVGGDPEARHGIVLAKNYIAKKFGVQTGEALWEARKKCPNIVFVSPHFDRYLKFSKLANEIYREYTDQVEGFGLDENWLDVTGSQIFGSGEAIANELRERVKSELGITASVGVSFNKIFAKLGSDMKKPDATTVITEEDFREKVWPLPAEDLLFVGRATKEKLNGYGIKTIGEIANMDRQILDSWFGKNGLTLWQFANGLDMSPVRLIDTYSPIKSVGNSTTTPRDLVSDEDIKITLYALSESVAARLRDGDYLCKTISVSVRYNNLEWFERQCKVTYPTCVSDIIAHVAYGLFQHNIMRPYAVRSLGVRATDLISNTERQMSFMPTEIKNIKQETIEHAIDKIRNRFGHFSIQRGIMFEDRVLSSLNPKSDHTIHPIGYR